ncbi:MAG: NAD-dependent DNA ligase LigA [Lachnospiraceae bacterium]|nr:NAD-dependent DNA ligase LigA [Lachnospiraceae bacterium]
MEQKLERIKELTGLLNRAARAYYQENREIMPNVEYDRLYDELKALESETGVTLSGSPTAMVGYEILSELPKERHAAAMLSLDKTKDVEALKDWLGDREGILSWKLDGLTIVLTYQDGELYKAVTRGNGETGEVVTANARAFENVPLRIPHRGEVVLRGEAVIRYSDFEKINEEIGDADSRYKNPRNLCSGSVRQLNSQITSGRHVRFYAFFLVSAENADFENSRENQFLWLKAQGFDVVEYRKVDAKSVEAGVQAFASAVEKNDVPSDGLVLCFEDIAYGEGLGRTAKFPRHSIAFKWEDELGETRLRYIEWSPSRTGLINPVAVFEPVELEGTTVSRASVHNISILKELALGEGDTITVYKANMIIPQIAENKTRSGPVEIPSLCPVCGGPTKILAEGDAQTLHCMNPECQAKRVKRFALFASRDALNIDGLSEATLEKLIGIGAVKEAADLFCLEEHRDAVVALEGFGEKSFDNLCQAAIRASQTTLPRLIYGLGIANIGPANARMICRAFDYDLDQIMAADREELAAVDGIGPVIADAFAAYFESEKNRESLAHILSHLTIQKEETGSDQSLAGQIYVITGSLTQFANRDQLKAYIEERGGKVTGSVTGKTTYLINNDSTSNSSKNKKARELGVAILTEEEFLNSMKGE